MEQKWRYNDESSREERNDEKENLYISRQREKDEGQSFHTDADKKTKREIIIAFVAVHVAET